jgi:hypothetical protein
MSETFKILPRRMPQASLPAHATNGELIITSDTGAMFVGKGPSAALMQVGGGAMPTGSGNQVLATPADGSSAAASLRALVAADIPSLSSRYDLAGAAATAQANAEAFVTSSVGVETNRAEVAEALLASSASLTAEASARTSAIGVETSRAETAEALLASTTSVTTAIAVETTRAEAAEALLASSASLTTAISAEVTNRNTAIATEVTNRNTAIAVETTRALTAEALLASTTSVTTAVGVEKTRALAAEALLASIASVPTSFAWNVEAPATAALSLANTSFGSTFTQTSAVAWLWSNITAGSAVSTNASPLLELAANYYTGSISAQDLWTLGTSLVAGTNGISTLTFAHTGSSGQPQIQFPTGGATNPSLIGAGGATCGITIAPNSASALVCNTPSGSTTFLAGYHSGVAIGVIGAGTNMNDMTIFNTNGVGLWMGVSGPGTTYFSWEHPPICIGHIGQWQTKGPGPFVGLELGALYSGDSESSPYIYWSPLYGAGNLVGMQIAPIVNQIAVSNPITGVSQTTTVVTVGLSSANAYTASGLIQVAAITNTAINGTFTLTSQISRTGSPYTITNAIETSGNIVTLTIGTHAVVANDYVYLAGLNTFTWLNSKFVKVTSVVANVSITFTDPTAHGVQATIAQTGTVQDNYVTYTAPSGTIAAGPDTGTVVMGSTGSYTGLLISPSPQALLNTNNKYLDCQDTFYVNNIVESSGSVVTLTITGGNCTLVAGQQISIGYLYIGGGGSGNAATWLTGLTGITLLSATATTITFNDPTSHGTLVSTALQGGYVSSPSKFSVATTGTVTLAVQPASPTSAGTAGQVGQLMYAGTNLYLCTVTGAAGSATWSKINLTAV